MEGNTLIILVVVGLVAILTGFLISRYVLNKTMRTKEQLAEQKAKAIVKDAEADSEVIKKNKILEAKEKFSVKTCSVVIIENLRKID